MQIGGGGKWLRKGDTCGVQIWEALMGAERVRGPVEKFMKRLVEYGWWRFCEPKITKRFAARPLAGFVSKAGRAMPAYKCQNHGSVDGPGLAPN